MQSRSQSENNNEHLLLEIEVLNDLLDEFLLKENYELCCVFRDRLKRLGICRVSESSNNVIMVEPHEK